MNYMQSEINSLLFQTKKELREYKDFTRDEHKEHIAHIIDSAVERMGEIIMDCTMRENERDYE